MNYVRVESCRENYIAEAPPYAPAMAGNMHKLNVEALSQERFEDLKQAFNTVISL
jgi:hypothetical protein